MSKSSFRSGPSRREPKTPAFHQQLRWLFRRGGLTDSEKRVIGSVVMASDATREPLISRDAVAGMAGISSSYSRAILRRFDAICGYAKRTADHLGESASRFYTFRVFKGKPGCWGRNIWMGRRLVRALARKLLPTQSIGIQLRDGDYAAPAFLALGPREPPHLASLNFWTIYLGVVKVLHGSVERANRFVGRAAARVEVAIA